MKTISIDQQTASKLHAHVVNDYVLELIGEDNSKFYLVDEKSWKTIKEYVLFQKGTAIELVLRDHILNDTIPFPGGEYTD